ncbi:MAG: hypothetical protein QE495_15595 [Acidovorax sp.]|jgi:hypothetical protein|uniref:hypothetical protein n=1 Tax=Acidovorax sp. TaxID=1872122 RepID=UPI002616346A|nr:hypothetical protein [Acidovorax sp.]MDH4427879.1 hypothetical protein [Acidovorax sp.]MDH4466118.1 hypothetical protein [Acidovorax sp.]
MKYAALILNVVAVALLGWALYGVVELAQARTPAVRPMVTELAPLPVALRTDQARVMDAFDAMARIQAKAASPGVDPLSLIALPAPGREIVGSVQMPSRSLSLHLDDLATDRQSVVVDERLARQGTRLTEGGRIAKVQPNEVLVTERLGRQKLTLPTSELRVGTLRWPDGSLASVNTQEFKAGVPGTPPGPVRSVP